MWFFTDQMHRNINLDCFPPQRIVSLVPSQTELLHDLGLEAEVVGITKFCVHPKHWYQEKNRVGGTKTVNLEKIAALQPDLIIGNKEENDREQIGVLAAQYPVWMSDISDLPTALDMIGGVGALTGKSEKAQVLVYKIKQAFEKIRVPATRIKAAYFIWQKPYMVAGSDTFIDAMLREAGFENVFQEQERYPEIRLEDVVAANPDVILLASEPFPFSEKHFGAFQEACPKAEIKMVDGEMFSWYGSRLLEAPGYFRQLKAALALH